MLNIFRLSLLLLFFSCSTVLFAQQKIHPIEWADQEFKSDGKNLLVFIHTDWCQYCKAMENRTFTDKKVKELLAKNYHFTQLNAEEKMPIQFAGRTFEYKPTGKDTGFHELATTLANVEGEISYPTLVILNPKREIIFQYNGFLTARDLTKILQEINNSES